MYASWLTVDQASTRLRSSAASANRADPSMVTQAITASTVMAVSDSANTGSNRATRKTPAATMVAA